MVTVMIRAACTIKSSQSMLDMRSEGSLKTHRLLLAQLPCVLVALILPLEGQNDPRSGVHDGHAVEEANKNGERERRRAAVTVG